MIESNCLIDECSWQVSSDDDFERKLLMHCEAHVHDYDSIVDTTFDDDDDEDDTIDSFTIIQIGAEEHNDPPSDVNIVSNYTTSDANIVSVIQEEETGVEVVMQRLCNSCAMDVTDVIDFGQCPFCMAAKTFDLNFEDDSSSLGLCVDRSHSTEDGENHDREQPNAAMLPGLTPSTPEDRRIGKGKQIDKLLKGMIASFWQENKNAQGQQPTIRIQPTEEEVESRDDASPVTNPKTSAMHDDESSNPRELNVKNETNFQCLHDVDKFVASNRASNLLVESSSIESQANMATHDYGSNNADAIAARSQLILLENYYSKQQK